MVFSYSNLFNNLLSGSCFRLISIDCISQLSLVSLDGFQSLSIGLIGMVQSNFKLIDCAFQLLLDSQTFILCSLFSLQGGIERVHCSGMILPGVFKLFFFLSNTTINLLLSLRQLQLSSQNLIFLLFKSSLSLFKSTLEL